MKAQDAEVSLQERLSKSPPPDWLVKMHEHYAKTGTYRPEDLLRLLGDPNRRVEVGPTSSLSSFLGQA